MRTLDQLQDELDQREQDEHRYLFGTDRPHQPDLRPRTTIGRVLSRDNYGNEQFTLVVRMADGMVCGSRYGSASVGVPFNGEGMTDAEATEKFAEQMRAGWWAKGMTYWVEPATYCPKCGNKLFTHWVKTDVPFTAHTGHTCTECFT